MFIIFGFGHKTIKDGGQVERSVCPRCNNYVNASCLRVKTWFTLFFIPIIPYRSEYCLFCPICSYTSESSRAEFEQLREGAAAHYGGYPGEGAQAPVGKTETQLNYLRQMEELRNRKDSQ